MGRRGRESFRFILYLSLVGLLAACLPTTPAATTTPTPVPATINSTITVFPTAVVTLQTTVTPEIVSDAPDRYSFNIKYTIPFTFTGQVTRGEFYEKEINAHLLFCLIPYEYAEVGFMGWWITLRNKTENSCRTGLEYAGPVTPPFYGVNELSVLGWHFRNADNTGPNDGSVNAPQEIRSFRFVLTEQDEQTIAQAHECLFRNKCNELTPQEADSIIWAIPKARGTLTITDLVLGNLVVGEQAWIESMSFTVELLLPQGFVTE